jgi:hypothetical protein
VVLKCGRVIENNCYSTDTIKIILEIKKKLFIMNTKSKKTVLGFIAVSAIAALAAVNVSINKQGDKLSDVSLANVEALALEIQIGAPCMEKNNSECVYNWADGTTTILDGYPYNW